MTHRIKYASPLTKFRLLVGFSDGSSRVFSAEVLIKKDPVFSVFKQDPDKFWTAAASEDGRTVIWKAEGCSGTVIPAADIIEKGKRLKTPFDGMLAFSDASEIWGLNESTLRKAIFYGKLKEGSDICKFGKQWVVTYSAMVREYGKPRESDSKKKKLSSEE